jgi:hypothetical protein
MHHDKLLADSRGIGPMAQRIDAGADLCPIHGYILVNVHKVRDGERLVIGQTCPDPHCQHAVMFPKPARTTPTRNAG